MIKKLTVNNGLKLFAMAVLAITILSFTNKSEKMSIETGQAAPTFSVKDVNGNIVNLSDYKGRKVLLTFYRNVGCPICNLRFHEVQQQADYFKSKNLVVLAVYESTAENMKKYLSGENPYAIMLPNPEENIYQLYNIEKSKGKAFKTIFHGGIKKAKQGSKLFKTKMKQDGDGNTIGADFLIDEDGKVIAAYYGKYIGDHMPIDEIN